MNMRKISYIIVLLFLTIANVAMGQGRSLTFTSITDAKFFVYINGRLQNEKSTGMLTINNLEDKEYHVRIVIDDPFEVAATQRIRPEEKGSEYTVRFNAVRERVYIKKSDSRKTRRDESSWIGAEQTVTTPEKSEETAEKSKRRTLRQDSYEDTATQRVVNKIRYRVEN